LFPYLGLIGLILNLAGTLMIAFSFGSNLADAHQLNFRGRKVQLASFLHPRLFWLGLILLGLGFVLQIAKEATSLAGFSP